MGNGDTTQVTAPAARSGSWSKRILIAIAVLLALLVVLPLASLAVLGTTEGGSRLAWRAATALVPGLSGHLTQGTLAHGIELREFRFDGAGSRIMADRIRGRWSLDWRPLTLAIESIEIGTLDVTPIPQPDDDSKKTPPRSLRLPLAFDLRSATVGVLRLHLENGTQSVSGIEISARSDRVNHQLALLHALTAWGPLRADVSIDGSRPVRLNGNVRLDGRILDIPLTASLRLSGPIERLDVRLRAESLKLDGQVDLIATPFSDLPLHSARVEIDHLDPRMFVPTAPRADLHMRAMLEPEQLDSGAWRVSGPVTIRNDMPGAIDQERIPLQSAQALVLLEEARQQINDLQLVLPGNGSLRGNASLAGDSAEVQLQAQRIDLQRLLSTLQATDLAGPISVKRDGPGQRLEARLSGRPMAIHALAELTPQEIVVQRAELQSGPSQLEVSGKLRRDDASYALQGKLQSFEPSRFIGMLPATAGERARPLPEDIRINMDFAATGRLEPELLADLNFEIRRSRFNRLPMSGKGNLRLQGEKLLPSKADLRIAGNKVSLDGSFGEPGSRLQFAIDAPALARLGVGASGSLQTSGTLAGTIEAPTLQAEWNADRLAYGDYRLAQASGHANLVGVPGRDAAATVNLTLNGNGINAGELVLGRLRASVQGSSKDHEVALAADGRFRGQPLDVELATRGALSGVGGKRSKTSVMTWKGTIDKLESRGFPHLSLQRPLPLQASAAGTLELGATRLLLEQATIDLSELVLREEMLRTAGRLQQLNVGHLLALQQKLTGKDLPVMSDLVLDGQWDLTLKEQAAGNVSLSRRQGDLTFKTDRGQVAIGINRLGLNAMIEGSAVRVNADIETQRLGSIDADGSIGLLRVGQWMTVGPESTLAMRVVTAVPRLSNIASLAGPRVALEGQLNGDVRVGGTLGDPRISGNVLADKLALTLFDQGVRLHDGIARLTLNDNVIDLQQVEFHGGDGTLRATGRIPLNGVSNDMGATIVAERLQLLADPSRQLTLSGKADAVNRNGQLQIKGGFTVDDALFSLPEKSAPTLDDDVIVIDRQTAPPPKSVAGQPEQPKLFPPLVELELNLGRNFRFRGSGADLRLAGALTIRSGPAQPAQAFGTIRVADGIFEAFGAKLSIERGLVTFQGPFKTPSLNVIAMRREQEVPAGVQVTGTAQKPRIQVISEPDLPEEEKLSWLVFGRGSSSGGGAVNQAQAALQGATVGLFNKLGGNRIASDLGLNQLAIGSSDYGDLAGQPVVTLGKEISNRLYIGYEQSLSGIGGVLKLTYELTRHWSVVLLGGAVSGLDLLYSERFDEWGEEKRWRRRRSPPAQPN